MLIINTAICDVRYEIFDLLPITIIAHQIYYNIINKFIYYDMSTVTRSVKINHLIAKNCRFSSLLMWSIFAGPVTIITCE